MKQDLNIYSWLNEASKEEILRDILNETFSYKDTKIIDWVYILIEDKVEQHNSIINIYSIDAKNAFIFDLNILFRNKFKYIYKISVLKDI